MDEKILYMYILMILVLLVGFLMGWILRRSAYKKQYEDRVYELQDIEEEKFEKFSRVEADLESLQNLYLDTKDSLRAKSERLDSYAYQNNKLNMEIDRVKKSNELLIHNIPVVDDRINDALVDLEKVKNARNAFLEQIDEVNSCEHDILELSKDIQSIEMLVSPAFERKNELSRSIERFTEYFEEQEKQLHESDVKIIESKEEHLLKKSSIELEFEESKVEEERYGGVLAKIENKIIDGQNIFTSDFLGLLDTKVTNSSGWFNHLYKKSKNLFRGEK